MSNLDISLFSNFKFKDIDLNYKIEGKIENFEYPGRKEYFIELLTNLFDASVRDTILTFENALLLATEPKLSPVLEQIWKMERYSNIALVLEKLGESLIK